MKIVHVITCLEMGGAETMLHRLLSQLDATRYESIVVSLASPGPMTEPIKALGIPVLSLDVRHPASIPFAITRLTRLLRREKPEIVQTWMYHADLVGGSAAWLAGRLATIWNIRNGTLEPEVNKRTTIWTANLCARLSRRMPIRIISCSLAARTLHAERGYDRERMVVIPNGFDIDRFRPDLKARQDVRQELGLPANAQLIGMIARFDPQKDHRTFFQAAARLRASTPDVHFVLCGDGIDWGNSDLVDWIDRGGIRQRCHLLGRRHDIQRFQASFDIATLSSWSGEGFPNVVGEAMACGVPCVVTDVGDSAWIVGDTGHVVPPRDPDALHAAIDRLLGDLERGSVDARTVRDRIVANFSVLALLDNSEWAFRQLLVMT